jgi:Uma2 family endonuclease
MTQLAVGPPPVATEVADEQRLLLRGIDWQSYRAAREAFKELHLRMIYDRGNLELMTISRSHSRFSRLLGRLIAVLTEEFGLPILSCGDMTCDREDLDRAFEADESFYIQNAHRVRPLGEIDLTVEPPPDLIVEIEISRTARNRMDIYAALRVPEVWRFDGTNLTVYLLQSNGAYAVASRSAAFPSIPVRDIARFLLDQTHPDENSLVHAFRLWVREQIAKAAPPAP